MTLSVEEKAARNRANVKRWRRENPEKRRAQARAEKARAYARDPAKYIERSKVTRKSMPEYYSEYNSRYYAMLPIAKKLFYNAAARAKAKGLPFSITIGDVVVPENCPVLGMPLKSAIGQHKGFYPTSPTLDRIIPGLGYVPGNIMVISNLANLLKRDMTDPAPIRAVADYVERETARVRRELG